MSARRAEAGLAASRTGSAPLAAIAERAAATTSVIVPTGRLLLADGRELAYALYGAPGGRPVHFFHGFPSSRRLAALVHGKALAAGVCLVAADRPGFGRSTPLPGRTLADWPADVAALADHLGHDCFDVVGISCGGAYALACAAAMPARVRRVALMAGMGPMDIRAIRRRQHPALRLMFALARIHPLLASPIFLMDRSVFRGERERALAMMDSMMTLPDREALAANPGADGQFIASMAEAYRQGIGAAMQEARLIALPRPYRLEDIRVPVHVFQGAIDRHVPMSMGEYLAKTLPRGRLHAYSGEGHLSIVLNRFDECLAVLERTDPAHESTH